MIAIRALGPPRVTVDGHAAPELQWKKNLALLVYLARSPRRTRTREHLVALFWADRPATAARHSLREAIRLLRAAAGEAALVAEGDQLRLADGAVDLDTDRFAALADAGDWAAAAALAQGEFLEGFGVPDASDFEDWLAGERQAWRRRCIAALVSCADAQAGRGDAAAAAELARRALALDGCAEDAARCAMAALALAGDRAGALAVYEEYSRRLRDTLGAAPAAATGELAARIRAAPLPTPPGRAAPPAGAETRRAPLIGRERELGALLDSWRRCRAAGDARACATALLGDAGTGRTRLLDELAARARLDGATVVACRAVPADRDAAGSGLLALAGGGLLDAPGVGAAPPGALAAIAARLDEWQERFPGVAGTTGLPLGAAWSQAVRAAAEERPLVVIVDDAHYLDTPSLHAIEATLRDGAALPLLVAVSAAPWATSDAFTEWLARLGRDVPGGTLRLGPLDHDALCALSRWAVPAYDAAAVDRLARRIAADSAGLPLLAVELLHAVALGLDLAERQDTWPAPSRTLDQTLPSELPGTITAAIRVGFRRLGRDAQAALAAISVLDDPAAAERIGRATGLAGSELGAALDELEWERWVVAGPRGYGCLARIVRDIVAADLVTPGQRQRILAGAGA